MSNLRPFPKGQSRNPGSRQKGIAARARQHTDRALEVLAEALQEEGGVPSFGETSQDVPMPNGGKRSERSFDMDRRGFTILSMGFTGKCSDPAAPAVPNETAKDDIKLAEIDENLARGDLSPASRPRKADG